MELQELAKRFEENQSEILQAYENEKKVILSNWEARKTENEKKYKKDIHIVNKEIANEFEQLNISLSRILSQFLPADRRDDNSILRAAEYLNLGEMLFSGKDFNIHHDISTPLLVSFLGHSNIFLTSSVGDKCATVRDLMLRALMSTAPGQLELIVFDPDLTQVMAPFSKMNGDDINLRVIHTEEELSDTLHNLTEIITDIENEMQNMFENLIDFRQKAEQPIGKYYIVTFLSFADKFNEKLYRKMIDVMKVSAKAGVSFIIDYDERRLPDYVNLEEIKNCCQCLKRLSRNILLEGKRYKCLFETKSVSEIVSIVSEYVKETENMKGVPIKFSDIVSKSSWNCSSADGIIFPIGKEGLSEAFISLGDELNQLHNVIITGAVGQGKSNLIKVIVHSICAKYSPDEVSLYLLDFKEGVTLAPFSDIGKNDYLPHAKVLGLESDRRFGLEVLRHINNIMVERNEEFRKDGCDNIAKYRKSNPNVIMPRIVLIIDEFYFMFNVDDKIGEAAADYLETIARKGRASGIHIILASQTISGAAALLVRQDGIFGQFSTRVALKNNITESYATLTQGNDGAARLKVRGQAVINNEFGRVGSNKIITVAWAPDEYFDEIRKFWWNKVNLISNPPISFVGSAYRFISESLPTVKEIGKSVASGESEIKGVIGISIAIDQKPICINMGHDVGRNVAVFGSGDNKRSADSGIATNNVLGIMQSLTLSLALQHHNDDAKFIMLNLLDKITFEKNQMPLWLETMKRIGHEVEIVEKSDISSFIVNIADCIKSQTIDSGSVYILGFAMEQASSLHIQDPETFAAPAEAFSDILAFGPSRRVHFFGCWKNIQAYNKLMGFEGDGYMGTKIVLHLDKARTRELIDPLIEWESDDNRALILDQSLGEAPEIMIPFVPLRQEDSDAIKSVMEEGDIY